MWRWGKRCASALQKHRAAPRISCKKVKGASSLVRGLDVVGRKDARLARLLHGAGKPARLALGAKKRECEEGRRASTERANGTTLRATYVRCRPVENNFVVKVKGELVRLCRLVVVEGVHDSARGQR